MLFVEKVHFHYHYSRFWNQNWIEFPMNINTYGILRVSTKQHQFCQSSHQPFYPNKKTAVFTAGTCWLCRGKLGKTTKNVVFFPNSFGTWSFAGDSERHLDKTLSLEDSKLCVFQSWLEFLKWKTPLTENSLTEFLKTTITHSRGKGLPSQNGRLKDVLHCDAPFKQLKILWALSTIFYVLYVLYML